jgi:hypothetical protein
MPVNRRLASIVAVITALPDTTPPTSPSLARTCGRLDEKLVRPLVAAALLDSHPYVRGRAVEAASDAAHYLEWSMESRRDA